MYALRQSRTPTVSDLAVEPLSGRDIAAFVAAVESGSVQGAADTLRLTQSAVSKRIQALERRTAAALLVRGRQGVRPTEAGRVLYPEAKQALAALARAAAAVDEAAAGEVHVLRLAASHTIGEFLLPRWLAGFRASDSDTTLRVEVDVVNSPAVLAQVRSGAAAVGFVEGLDALEGLDTITLMRDELVVVVDAAHPWARRGAVRPHELANEPYLARERDSGGRAVVTAALAEQGIELHPALETPSIEALKRAVRDSGFTVLSSVTVDTEVLDGSLRAVRVPGLSLHRQLRAVLLERERADPAARRFWAWLANR